MISAALAFPPWDLPRPFAVFLFAAFLIRCRSAELLRSSSAEEMAVARLRHVGLGSLGTRPYARRLSPTPECVIRYQESYKGCYYCYVIIQLSISRESSNGSQRTPSIPTTPVRSQIPDLQGYLCTPPAAGAHELPEIFVCLPSQIFANPPAGSTFYCRTLSFAVAASEMNPHPVMD